MRSLAASLRAISDSHASPVSDSWDVTEGTRNDGRYAGTLKNSRGQPPVFIPINQFGEIVLHARSRPSELQLRPRLRFLSKYAVGKYVGGNDQQKSFISVSIISCMGYLIHL